MTYLLTYLIIAVTIAFLIPYAKFRLVINAKKKRIARLRMHLAVERNIRYEQTMESIKRKEKLDSSGFRETFFDNYLANEIKIDDTGIEKVPYREII